VFWLQPKTIIHVWFFYKFTMKTQDNLTRGKDEFWTIINVHNHMYMKWLRLFALSNKWDLNDNIWFQYINQQRHLIKYNSWQVSNYSTFCHWSAILTESTSTTEYKSNMLISAFYLYSFVPADSLRMALWHQHVQ